MTNSRFYSSIASATNLQVTAAPSDTSIQVASSVGWPSSFPFIIALDYGSANEELVLVTSGGPSIFTVTRAYDGTPATTHNAGAVVRHTSSAIDFTDSRTHEGSSTGVHGITGQFVDTLSTQTLANKTLNSPVINNATVTGTVTATGATVNNGTFSGGTFSGTVSGGSMTGTITGSPSFTGGPKFTTISPLFQRTNTGDPAITVNITTDTFARLQSQADGTLRWGSGTSATDVFLNRSGIGTLNITGSLTATGEISWTGTPWTDYTANWTATTTNPFVGLNGSILARYKQIGKTVTVAINILPGTGGFLTGSGTYSISLPFASANTGLTTLGEFHILTNGGSPRYMGQCVVSPNASAMSGFIPQISGGNATGAAVVWSSTSPAAGGPGVGDQFRFQVTYEAA